MYDLSENEVDFILEDIAKRGIETEDVRYNILDHVCCIIENEMKPGTNFKEFYRNTIARFYKVELNEIEQETRDLITFKYYYAMKRTLKITGLLTIVLCLIGSLLKFLHVPGAGLVLFSSLCFFGLIFIPLNIIVKLKYEKEQTNKVIVTFGLILGMFITFGLIFKTFHWPGATIITMSGVLVFALVFVPVYFFTRYKNPDTRFNAIVHTTFMIVGAGFLFGMVSGNTSHKTNQMVANMSTVQLDNLNRMEASNAVLYTELGDNPNINEVGKFSDALIDLLNELQINLIAKSENISLDNARKVKVNEVKHPEDRLVITNYFLKENTTFNLSALKKGVLNYNAELNLVETSGVLREIELKEEHFIQGDLAVVLNELMNIKNQILTNENSFLCLQKGMLAQN